MAHGLHEARGPREHVARACKAGFAKTRGEKPAFGGAAGMQRLRHAIAAKSLLQPRGHRRRVCERGRYLRFVKIERDRCRDTGAERSDRARGMPIRIVSRIHRRAKAIRDLVASDHGPQKHASLCLLILTSSEGGGNDADTRMIEGRAVDVVELEHMRCGAGNECSQPGMASRWANAT